MPVGLAAVVEVSLQKVYPRVTLATARTLSGSVERTLRGGEGLPKMFCLVAPSLGHLRSQGSIVCGSSLQRRHRGSAEICVGFQQRSAPPVGLVAVIVVTVIVQGDRLVSSP